MTTCNHAAVSRRSFAKGAGMVGATALAAGAFGAAGALAAEGAAAPEGTPCEISRTVDVDVVVAGAGASGTTAALVAAEGGKNVLLLEKRDRIGGAGAISGGLLGCGSSLQQQAGYDVRADDMFAAWNEYNHSLCYGPLVKTIFGGSAATVEWLLGHGVPLEASPGSNQGAHMADPLKWQCYHRYIDRNGQAAFDALQPALEEAGAQIVFGATLVDLVQDADGAVTGLVYRDADGSCVQVNAAKTVLATGGFDGNDAMMADVFGCTSIAGLKVFGIDNQGEGTLAAWKAGARRWNTQSALFHGGNPATPDMTLTNPAIQGLLEVDGSGRRFADETVISSTCLWANANLSTGGWIYILLDDALVEDYVNNAVAVEPLNVDTIPPAADTSAFRDELASSAQIGVVFSGETLEELAGALGMDPQVLTATVERYNAAVEAGADEEFGKDPAWLSYKVEQGPFYAIKCGVGSLGTSGGLFVNTAMQPLTQGMRPVENLYCVGSMAAGAYYGSLPGYPDYEGAALCFAYTSGRLAGEDILACM